MPHRTLKAGTAILLVILAIASCANPTSSSPTTASLPAAPAASAANDSSVLGVYKGVLADTDMSASFWVSVQGSAPPASLVRAAAASLTATINIFINSSVLVTITVTPTADGSGNYPIAFSWSYAGKSYALSFLVSSTGVISAPALTSNGQSAGVSLAKETSSTVVSTWEGTTTGNSVSGTWNFLLKGSGSGASLSGTYQGTANGEPMGGSFGGTVNSDDSITFSNLSPGAPDIVTGSFSGFAVGASVSGTWGFSSDIIYGQQVSGTWSGTRKQ